MLDEIPSQVVDAEEEEEEEGIGEFWNFQLQAVIIESSFS